MASKWESQKKGYLDDSDWISKAKLLTAEETVKNVNENVVSEEIEENQIPGEFLRCKNSLKNRKKFSDKVYFISGFVLDVIIIIKEVVLVNFVILRA
jgi:hypothetical protein